MNFDFTGKTVVVTGGSRGIGKSIAMTYAKAGAKVAVTYSSNDSAAEAVMSQMPGSGHKCYKFNVADFEQVESNFEQIQKDLGTPYALINNAGITRDQLLLRLKPEDWDDVLTTNLKSVYNCSKVAVKMMLRAKEGSIVNITSVIGQTGNAGQSNYAASKAGIIGFTKSIAQEVASRQIRLNCIAPGFIQSDMTDALTEEQRTNILNKVPLGFIGDPEDVSWACLFLTSPMSRYITGQTINVNGGLFMN